MLLLFLQKKVAKNREAQEIASTLFCANNTQGNFNHT